MPVPVIYGIAIGVIRLIPIAIRIGGKIVGIGYRIAAKPQYLKHAQKIFGKNNVIREGSADKIIQQIARYNTKTQTLSPIKSAAIKDQIKGSIEVAKNIGSQADDAALKISKFISTSRVQTMGGTNVTVPIKQIFGKNIKFSKNTLEAIKIAERGPTALGKDIVATKVATETAKKIPEVIKLKQTVAPTVKTGKEVAKVITETVKPPWYVAVMPSFLRTSKTIVQKAKGGIPIYPTIHKTTQALKYPRTTKAVIGAATVAPFLPYPERTPKQPHKDIDLNMDKLFGGVIEGYEQLDITSGIDFYDEDEQGNIIQAR